MNKKTVILTLEVGNRELDSTLLLSRHLLQLDYRVIIGTNRAVKLLEGLVQSSIFLHKSTINRYAQRYQTTLGAKVCFLDVESGVTVPDGRYQKWCEERFFEVSDKKYHSVFTIGPVYNRWMLKMKQFTGVSLIASGWPRLDLLHPKNRHFYTKTVEDLKHKYGKFILVVSSFGFVNRKEYDAWSTVDKQFFGEDYNNPALEYLEKFTDLAKNLASKSKHSVILRPHPAEFKKSWEDKLKGTENLSIVGEGDIIPWLIAAERIVQFRSSTALEAALLGRESLALAIDGKKYDTDSPVYKLNKEFESSDELIDYIDSNYEDGIRITENAKCILSDYIANLDGKACEAITLELRKIPIKAVAPPKISWFRSLRHKYFMSFADLIEYILFNRWYSPKILRFVFTYKQKLGPSLTQTTCSAILERLGESNDRYHITQLGRDLIQLEADNNMLDNNVS